MQSGILRRHMRTLLLFSIALLPFFAGCESRIRIDGSAAVVAQSEATPVSPSASEPPDTTAEDAPATSLPHTGASTPSATETSVPSPTAAPATASPQPPPTPTPTSTPTLFPTATPTASPTVEPTATYPAPPDAVNVPILMYHYVSELPADADVYRRDLTVTPDRFEAQMRYLKEEGYTTVILSDIYEALTEGKPLPPRPIVLTFDDGYKDAYAHVLPVLQEYGFIGEFFVLATPAHYQAPHYLSWNDMKEMADAGMSMQAHGRDHVELTNRANDFLVYQILGAREAVEAHTGQPVRFFCYPSGRHDEATRAVVASAGYWGAVTTAWGTELRLDNRYTWPRIRIKGAWELESYASVLSGLERNR
jgi:peptidoglycan/xylan/chitin deacetylase (PgdA/CDA1 family)